MRQRTRAGNKVQLDTLDDNTWVLRRRGKSSRVVRRIGPPRLRADIVVDQRSLRSNAQGYQLNLLRWLGEEHVSWLLQQLDVNVVLDVGANRGQYAKRLRENGYTGRIVSFEPVPQIAEELEKASAEDPEWHVLRYALGERVETSEIHVGVGQGRFSSLLPPTDFGKSCIDADTTVPVSVPRRRPPRRCRRRGGEPARVPQTRHPGLRPAGVRGRGRPSGRPRRHAVQVSLVPLYEGMPHLTDQLELRSRGIGLTGIFPVIVDRPTMRVIEFDAVMVRTEPDPV